MFGSDVLDIAIGMVFVYFLLSLLCTTIAELIARAFALRSATLYDSIRNLLVDPKTGKSDLLVEFWNHPRIAKLARSDAGHGIGVGNGKASYLETEAMALVIVDLIAGKVGPAGALKTPDGVKSAIENLGNDQLSMLLLAVIGDASSMQQIQDNLAKWFDEYMDRVSGWYKRKSQAIILALSLVLVLLLNADSLAIFNALSGNPQLRAAAVDVASNYLKDSAATSLTATRPLTGTQTTVDLAGPVAQILSLEGTLTKMNMPLTWAPADEKVPRDLTGWFYKILGLLTTAILVSLGAPFWYDLLGRIVNLRSTGKVLGKGNETDSSADSGGAPSRNDAAPPVVEKPSLPSADLEDLADKFVQTVDAFKAAGHPLPPDEEKTMAIKLLTREAARLELAVTPAQISTAVEAGFQRRGN
jgi:hypothetical protein